MESPTVGAEPGHRRRGPAPKSVPLSDRFTTPDEARKLAMLAEDPIDWTSAPPSSRGRWSKAAARDARMARLGLTGMRKSTGSCPWNSRDQCPADRGTDQADHAGLRHRARPAHTLRGGSRTLTESYRRERKHSTSRSSTSGLCRPARCAGTALAQGERQTLQTAGSTIIADQPACHLVDRGHPTARVPDRLCRGLRARPGPDRPRFQGSRARDDMLRSRANT
jgi:hypothetical protein